MADENIISVSSAAAESDPGNAENFLLGILPVSQPHHTWYFPTILLASLPYSQFLYHTPCFPTILPVSLKYPTIFFVYYPTIPYHTYNLLSMQQACGF